MNIKHFVIALCPIFLFTACNNQKIVWDKPTVEITKTFVVEEDDIGPPQANFKSRFKSVNEWLSFIAENELPKKAITTFNLDMFEGKDDYTLCLSGVNTYEITENKERVRIEYMPTEMYFPIPKTEHKGKSRTQVFAALTRQINVFITSEKFKKSFLAKAKSIRTGWSGEIWPVK